jgi:hypothetical protein
MSLKINQLSLAFGLFLAVFASSANAGNDKEKEVVSVVEITAEYYPKEKFHLGLELNSDQSLNRVYYENNEKQKRFYSMEDLRKRVVLMKTEDDGKVYNLVFLSVIPGKTGEYKFLISYMRNGLMKNMTATALFSLRYNKSRGEYDLIDASSGRVIERALVKTNYWFGKAVGIDEVITN